MNSSPVKKTLILLLTLLFLVQFVQPERSSAEAYGGNDITQVVEVPGEVRTILETSCYDCHSNHAVYPWYTYIQPVGLWIKHHINEGREELNFTEFKSYSLKRQLHKLDEIADVVEEGEMPMSSYTLIHKNAILTDAQKQILIQWAKNSRNNLKSDSTTASVSLKQNMKF